MESAPFRNKPQAVVRTDRRALVIFTVFAVLEVAITFVAFHWAAALTASICILLLALMAITTAVAVEEQITEAGAAFRLVQQERLAEDIVAKLGQSPMLAREVYERLGHALDKGFLQKKQQ